MIKKYLKGIKNFKVVYSKLVNLNLKSSFDNRVSLRKSNLDKYFEKLRCLDDVESHSFSIPNEVIKLLANPLKITNDDLLMILQSKDISLIRPLLKGLFNILDELDGEIRNQVFNYPVVQILLQFLNSDLSADFNEIRKLILKLINNFEYYGVYINQDTVVSILSEFIQKNSENLDLLEIAFCIIANICLEDSKQIDEIVIDIILYFIKNQVEKFKEARFFGSFLKILRNYYKYLPNMNQSNYEKITYFVIYIINYIDTSDEVLYYQSLLLFESLTFKNSSSNLIYLFISEKNFVSKYIKFDYSTKNKIQLNLLIKTMINLIVFSEEDHILYLINVGLIDLINYCLNLLSFKVQNIVHLLSNMTVKSLQIARKLEQFGFLEIITDLFHSKESSNLVKNQCLYFLANIAYLKDHQISNKLKNLGIIKLFLEGLQKNQDDIEISLEGLRSLFETQNDDYIINDDVMNEFATEFYENDGLDILEELLFNKNENIWKTVLDILEKYFQFSKEEYIQRIKESKENENYEIEEQEFN